VSSPRKSATARAPSRPTLRTSATPATLVTSSETTSGMMVMRMALTHSAPSGSTMRTAAASAGDPVVLAAAPSATPSTKAPRASTVAFGRRGPEGRGGSAGARTGAPGAGA
jgi:hypothetical protein